MDFARFLLSGKDKKNLQVVKNTLTQGGHIYVGYSSEPCNIIRHVRAYNPDLLIVEAGTAFSELAGVLEVIDEELLCASLIILDSRNEEVLEFLKRTRIMTYVSKPLFEDVLNQMADITVSNYKRILEYEDKVKKLNDTLEARKLVDKAKWLLVEQEGYTEAEAYNIIRKKSRDNRLTMKEIAEAIIIIRESDCSKEADKN